MDALLQAESTVVVAPYMNKLTKSEIHAVMTGGFATVAGSYMAVLIQVGVRNLNLSAFKKKIPVLFCHSLCT